MQPMTGKKVVLTFAPEGTPDCSTFDRDDVRFEVKPCGNDENKLIASGQGADGLIVVGIQPLTSKVLGKLDQCRVIATFGIGYDGIDLAAATERGMVVCNNPFYCLEEVSDHAMALILACARKLVRLDRAVRGLRWDSLAGGYIYREILPPVSRLRGQTLGIVGFGNIGRSLVPKAKGFGFNILACDPRVPSQAFERLGVEKVDLDRLLAESDFITVHVALTRDNRHMFGLEQLGRMKPTAYFINTARGGLVDEKALCLALSRGHIAGAALDVTEEEPLPADSPLLQFDNVILTAHTAHYSEQSQVELWRRPVDKVLCVLGGDWPEGVVNPEVKEKFLRRWHE